VCENSEKEVTNDLPRINERFGEAIKKKLEEKGWSFRGACIATGIAYGTIGNMQNGMVPTADNIIKWAKGLKEPINPWMELAGYEPIPEELVKETPEIPQTIMDSISQASTREAKIETAFEYVRQQVGALGSSSMGRDPLRSKLLLVRMYERLEHVKLLPDDIM
jgi:transcriptional regulator with XRE-family HTH domain